MSDSGHTLPAYIRSADDLVTSREATRRGFLQQALLKTTRAAPFVTGAKRLWEALQHVEQIDALLDVSLIRSDLLAAAGFSEKARTHLTPDDLESALKQVLSVIQAEAGQAFREEILYRYLLTKGDALGGMMRNLTGAVATQKLTVAIRNALQNQEIVIHQDRKSQKIRRIAWAQRLVLFDVRPTFIGKSIDVIVLRRTDANTSVRLLCEDPDSYLASGELKGGIDPAGADEHWKTARSALDRINESFDRLHMQRPPLFFVGAAIEAMMANEIFMRLQDGRLSYAANLSVDDQVADLARWLVHL